MFDESKVKFYDEIRFPYGNENCRKQIEEELRDELSFLSEDELKAAIEEELEYIPSSKDVKIKLLENYTKWAPSCFKKGAIGVVHDWRYFRYSGNTWYDVYVLVDIDGNEVAVNIDKLEVLDKDFLATEKEFFSKFKDTYKYENGTLTLKKGVEIHCTGLINRILDYLEN